ncbi:MAG: hypothetical protein KF688_01610 [Pirellulales bacterium]|nr:hypothetical protein [Pirellulales bacterium]
MANHRLAPIGRVLGFCALVAALRSSAEQARDVAPIDRRALVARHNVVHRAATAENFLQVGNGEFAFAFDATGLQTLDREFAPAIPLHTMANWGWHRFPNVDGRRYEETLSEFVVGRRTPTYADRQNTPAGEHFRANPHRFNLGRIGLWWRGQDAGGAVESADFTEFEQTLDLWRGVATSRYRFRGEPVVVTTVAHPRRDAIAVRIESPLVTRGELGVAVRFSYPRGEWGPAVDDFEQSERHRTTMRRDPAGPVAFARQVDDMQYLATCDPGPDAVVESWNEHARRINWLGADAGELVVEFRADDSHRDASPAEHAPAAATTSFADVRAAAAAHWESFWSNGGAIDLGAVADPRARELERRIVLSQYLAAIHNGSLPPQETGFVCNSWFGKQHLEMHWWHAAHLALWGREEALERSLAWYREILPQARAIAARQGYAGVRWPKMTGPDGVSSPSGVGEFLVWQQPHVIALAELVHRARPGDQTLSQYGDLVEATAEFMADFAEPDAAGTLHLGPPLIPAQECYAPRTTRDPTYELAYWRYALETAQAWRERAGRARNANWDRMLANLAAAPVRDGRYAAVAAEPFTKPDDHPSMLAALGVLPRTAGIDPATMRRTAAWVEENWQWESTWGWDYPMLAMTWARCGDPVRAVDALLHPSPKNRYLPNGHNYQEPRLPVYLPGNGGVLVATALMAAGWDDGPEQSAPGFPPEWPVRVEGLLRSP